MTDVVPNPKPKPNQARLLQELVNIAVEIRDGLKKAVLKQAFKEAMEEIEALDLSTESDEEEKDKSSFYHKSAPKRDHFRQSHG